MAEPIFNPVANGLRPAELLLVEDNIAEAALVVELFRQQKVANRIHHVNNGEKALDFLLKQGEYADAVRPDLVLLDLNLPRINGREVLETIRATPDICDLPVVVLSTSEQQEDIARSYALNVNAYVRKPIDLEGMRRVVSSIDEFWLTVACLPSYVENPPG